MFVALSSMIVQVGLLCFSIIYLLYVNYVPFDKQLWLLYKKIKIKKNTFQFFSRTDYRKISTISRTRR